MKSVALALLLFSSALSVAAGFQSGGGFEAVGGEIVTIREPVGDDLFRTEVKSGIVYLAGHVTTR